MSLWLTSRVVGTGSKLRRNVTRALGTVASNRNATLATARSAAAGGTVAGGTVAGGTVAGGTVAADSDGSESGCGCAGGDSGRGPCGAIGDGVVGPSEGSGRCVAAISGVTTAGGGPAAMSSPSRAPIATPSAPMATPAAAMPYSHHGRRCGSAEVTEPLIKSLVLVRGSAIRDRSADGVALG